MLLVMWTVVHRGTADQPDFWRRIVPTIPQENPTLPPGRGGKKMGYGVFCSALIMRPVTRSSSSPEMRGNFPKGTNHPAGRAGSNVPSNRQDPINFPCAPG